LESQIRLFEQKMMNFEKEMATLKEQKQQGKQQTYKLDYAVYVGFLPVFIAFGNTKKNFFVK
jgi:hypothetical protein